MSRWKVFQVKRIFRVIATRDGPYLFHRFRELQNRIHSTWQHKIELGLIAAVQCTILPSIVGILSTQPHLFQAGRHFGKKIQVFQRRRDTQPLCRNKIQPKVNRVNPFVYHYVLNAPIGISSKIIRRRITLINSITRTVSHTIHLREVGADMQDGIILQTERASLPSLNIPHEEGKQTDKEKKFFCHKGLSKYLSSQT